MSDTTLPRKLRIAERPAKRARRGVGFLRSIQQIRMRLRWGVLADSLDKASDAEIDDALNRLGISREDLFRPSKAVASHRKRLASMLAALRVDARQVVANHWQELKVADAQCKECRNVGRCVHWLEWGWTTAFDSAPMVFCPNAELWADIAEEQAAARQGAIGQDCPGSVNRQDSPTAK